MSSSIIIDDTFVGEVHPCFIIAEIAQAHDGSLGTAHAYIDAVAAAGANAIKFQTHIAEAESSPDEKFRVNSFPQDETRFDYWQRMEFSFEQWRELSRHASDAGLIFLSSPFSTEAVELLEEIGVPAWKVGSGEVENYSLLKSMASTGKPILLSTGMSSWSAIDEAVSLVEEQSGALAIFQCTTSYPCPPEKIGLNVLEELKHRYNHPVGLSDHSGTIFPSLAAAAAGVDLVEVHTVFSRECFGPDVAASVTTTELKQLIDGIHFIERAVNNPINKDEEAERMVELSQLFGKSVYIKRDVQAGRILSLRDVALKKPGTGIPAKRLYEVIGRTVTRAYQKNEQLKEADLA